MCRIPILKLFSFDFGESFVLILLGAFQHTTPAIEFGNFLAYKSAKFAPHDSPVM